MFYGEKDFLIGVAFAAAALLSTFVMSGSFSGEPTSSMKKPASELHAKAASNQTH